MRYQYTDEDLNKLHNILYEMLAEIDRVCKEKDIQYFVIGGTAIGVHFWNGIIPWDDDIDVGMTRENYDRFIKEAPAVLKPEFLLTWYGNDPHSPFYFAKLRKENTIFLEENCKNIKMHHGIFLDIFPFDKVPNNLRIQKIQRKICNRLNECFAGKEVWPWAYFGRCEIEKPDKKGFWGCLFTRIMVSILPKNVIYNMLCKVQSAFNNSDADYYNIVITSVDHIPAKDIMHPQILRFGPLMVVTPSNLESYLYSHYGKDLQRIPPKEKQINHAPLILDFDSSDIKAHTIS